MSKVEVNLLGIGAVELRSEQIVVYIDAFSELVKPQRVRKADLILVTHADGDHFEPQETARVAIETGAVIIGPPSIAYPLLANSNLPAKQLRIIYPIHFKKPIREELCGVKLKVYQTRHFNDWEPDHISYLVELGGKKFYVTGDSSMLDETDLDLKQLDGIMYSMVMDTSAPGAADAHVSAIEKVQQEFAPRYILPNHLIHCDWTIAPSVLQEAVRQRRLTGVIVVVDEEQVVEIL
jgi:L-ascorbate metabolism protein UlaG (beta-lactamase superfamily)